MTDRIIIAIGGGELKSKTTLKIDGYIADIVKEKNIGKRPMGLFIGTASHDSMPYFNSFRKTYTGCFDIKADCVLLCYNEMNMDKIADKIQRADFIYVGGGDTVFLIKKWQERGLVDLIQNAYNSGTILCGLSAGAICWFKNMFTDTAFNQTPDYNFYEGLSFIDGVCCPHYNLRKNDFDSAFLKSIYNNAYAIEDNCALVFKNEVFQNVVSAGGAGYYIENINGQILKKQLI